MTNADRAQMYNPYAPNAGYFDPATQMMLLQHMQQQQQRALAAAAGAGPGAGGGGGGKTKKGAAGRSGAAAAPNQQTQAAAQQVQAQAARAQQQQMMYHMQQMYAAAAAAAHKQSQSQSQSALQQPPALVGASSANSKPKSSKTKPKPKKSASVSGAPPGADAGAIGPFAANRVTRQNQPIATRSGASPARSPVRSQPPPPPPPPAPVPVVAAVQPSHITNAAASLQAGGTIAQLFPSPNRNANGAMQHHSSPAPPPAVAAAYGAGAVNAVNRSPAKPIIMQPTQAMLSRSPQIAAGGDRDRSEFGSGGADSSLNLTLRLEVWEWLIHCRAVEPAQGTYDPNQASIIVSADLSPFFKNGLVIARLLQFLLANHMIGAGAAAGGKAGNKKGGAAPPPPPPDGKKIDPRDLLYRIREAFSPIARLHNWNNLQIVLAQLYTISIDHDQKALLVSGDFESIARIVNLLYTRHSQRALVRGGSIGGSRSAPPDADPALPAVGSSNVSPPIVNRRLSASAKPGAAGGHEPPLLFNNNNFVHGSKHNSGDQRPNHKTQHQYSAAAATHQHDTDGYDDDREPSLMSSPIHTLSTLNTTKKLQARQLTKIMEFFVRSLVSHLSLTQEQAHSLLIPPQAVSVTTSLLSSTAGGAAAHQHQVQAANAELVHLFTHGLSGKFESIVSWLKDVYEHLNELTGLVVGSGAGGSGSDGPADAGASARALFYVCGTLRCGLLCSQSSDVAHWTCRVLSRFAFLLVWRSSHWLQCTSEFSFTLCCVVCKIVGACSRYERYRIHVVHCTCQWRYRRRTGLSHLLPTSETVCLVAAGALLS